MAREEDEELENAKGSSYGRRLPETLPPPTPEQEIDLIKRHREGDMKATEEILQRFLRLISTQAMRELSVATVSICDFDDLLFTGIEAFMRCLQTFDITRGRRFSTYFWMHLRGSLREAVQCHRHGLRISRHQFRSFAVGGQDGEYAPAAHAPLAIVPSATRDDASPGVFGEISDEVMSGNEVPIDECVEGQLALQDFFSSLDMTTKEVVFRKLGISPFPMGQSLQEISDNMEIPVAQIKRILSSVLPRSVIRLSNSLKREEDALVEDLIKRMTVPSGTTGSQMFETF